MKENLAELITQWIKEYAQNNKIQTLVIGVSGGIDSAVVSTLCAKTELPTIVLSMPILQSESTHSLSKKHCDWLKNNFPDNVISHELDLTEVFLSFQNYLKDFNSELAFANSRSRLRMMTLYQIAQTHNGIVVGTGNRVEDFGVGFFTKYGDGGVDISPIGNCLKTEVWQLGKHLGILDEIITAPPTDGLWNDGRTDEEQLGMTYQDLERMMLIDGKNDMIKLEKDDQKKLQHYQNIRSKNLHKMLPIPVFKFNN